MTTMTSQPHSPTHASDQFLDRMAEIDALVSFARGDTLTLTNLASFRPELLTFIDKDAQARAAVLRWARAFKSSISLLDQFRDAELSSSETATDDEVEVVMTAADEVIQALLDRLEKKFADRAST